MIARQISIGVRFEAASAEDLKSSVHQACFGVHLSTDILA
jgi:hypothetical protein